MEEKTVEFLLSIRPASEQEKEEKYLVFLMDVQKNVPFFLLKFIETTSILKIFHSRPCWLTRLYTKRPMATKLGHVTSPRCQSLQKQQHSSRWFSKTFSRYSHDCCLNDDPFSFHLISLPSWEGLVLDFTIASTINVLILLLWNKLQSMLVHEFIDRNV